MRGRSRPFRNHRQVVEGIVHRYRCGVAWRDLPERFGPWQTVWKRHARFSRDGTWDRILTAVLADADAAGDIDWAVSIDSTINRAHQHATTLPRERVDDLRPAHSQPISSPRWIDPSPHRRRGPRGCGPRLLAHLPGHARRDVPDGGKR
ncbi:transposase [Actinotalea sp. JY-7876]|uniref:transposase n=1 Tax=Actinotalea sp. JY-7876 TaxID=2758442 RepID=UPI00351BA169